MQKVADIVITDYDKKENHKNPDVVSSYYIKKSMKPTERSFDTQQNSFKRTPKTVVLNPKSPTFNESKAEKIHKISLERDLDYFMDQKINENLDKKYHSKRVQQINQNFLKHLKKEEFDKKEFSYCRKMLLMKKKEN